MRGGIGGYLARLGGVDSLVTPRTLVAACGGGGRRISIVSHRSHPTHTTHTAAHGPTPWCTTACRCERGLRANDVSGVSKRGDVITRDAIGVLMGAKERRVFTSEAGSGLVGCRAPASLRNSVFVSPVCAWLRKRARRLCGACATPPEQDLLGSNKNNPGRPAALPITAHSAELRAA